MSTLSSSSFLPALLLGATMLTSAHAQNATYMIGGVIRQGNFTASGNQFRVVNARDAHTVNSMKGADDASFRLLRIGRNEGSTQNRQLPLV